MSVTELSLPSIDRGIESYAHMTYAVRRAGIKSEHFSSHRNDVMDWAAYAVRELDENPYIWPDEKTILFMSTVDDYIASGQTAGFPLRFLLDEYGIGKKSEDSVQNHYGDTEDLTEEILGDPTLRERHSVQITRELKKTYFNKWLLKAPLRKTRSKFGVTRRNEKPYEVCATSLSTEQFEREFHSAAFCKRVGGASLLVFPENPDENHIHHEYIHSQWRISGGTRHFALYRGLEEAFVEKNTPSPLTYGPQRELFQKLDAEIPNFSALVYRAGLSAKAREKMLQAVMSTFGLSGVNIVSRYSPINGTASARFYSTAQQQIFIPMSRAHAQLEVVQ